MENTNNTGFVVLDVNEYNKMKQEYETLKQKCKELEEENIKYHKINENVWEQAKQWIQEDTKLIKSLEMSNNILKRKIQMYEYEVQQQKM